MPTMESWSSEDVKRWLRAEGFREFWPLLEPHGATGLDLIMLTSDDWKVLMEEPPPSVPSGHVNIIKLNRLLFKIRALRDHCRLHEDVRPSSPSAAPAAVAAAAADEPARPLKLRSDHLRNGRQCLNNTYYGGFFRYLYHI